MSDRSKERKDEDGAGFPFLPSDCGLIIHYLLRKVRGEEIPWDDVLDFELYGEKAPWEIFGGLDGEEEKKHYIFTRFQEEKHYILQDVQIPVTIVPTEAPTPSLKSPQASNTDLLLIEDGSLVGKIRVKT
jgi:hypothetical protein